MGTGQFNAQEMGCVDVPVSALSDNPQWFSSQGALVNVSQLLALQQCSAVSLHISIEIMKLVHRTVQSVEHYHMYMKLMHNECSLYRV